MATPPMKKRPPLKDCCSPAGWYICIRVVVHSHLPGMRAGVRTDDGEHSESFDVTQGQRQGCGLSPLMFNVFFAAVIHVVLVRVSEDGVIANRRLRDNQRQCARIQRKVAGDNGRFVPRFLKEDVSSLRKRSFEDSSNEAYSVADCDQERTAELAASDHPPGERIPRGVLPRQLMETRHRARVAEDEDRSRHREAKLQDMISRQMDDVGSILAERHGTAIAGDCVCEGRDREADDRAAGRREQDTRISSRGGEPIWCPPVVGAAEGLEGPSVGREQAHEDDEYIDGARSTRLLLNRAHATLARALTLEDGEHDGIDQEGDLAFRGRLPPPAGGPGCVEGPLRQESRGGWEGRQPSGPHEPPTFFTTISPNTRGQEKSQRERKNSGKGYRQKRARRRCPHVHVRARGWNNRQSED